MQNNCVKVVKIFGYNSVLLYLCTKKNNQKIEIMDNKVLIGGRALVALGSSRMTNDTDYLISDSTLGMFHHDEENNTDYCNAAKNKFFAEIWKKEKGNAIASPQSLLELKAYAFIQHCINGKWNKVNDAEYDIKFLVLKYNLTGCPILKKHSTPGEFAEVEKIIKSVKK